VTRLSDNEVVSFNTTDNPLPQSLDGFSIDLGPGTAAAGDRFLIQPTRFAAANIEVALNDGRQLALASPLSATANPGNDGTGEIVSVDLLDRDTAFTGNILDTPVEIEFVDGSGTYRIFQLDTANPPERIIPELATGLTTMPIDVNGEYSLTLTGSPAAGDVFRVLFNTGGISDNRNGLAMLELQQQSLLGSSSLQDAYGSTVGFVGTKANLALSNAEAGQIVLTNSENSRSSLSGVNLDEEAANLIKFEQAYNAAAQMISVSKTLFDTLLNSVR
jgi:flagellar hook-associated protein 1 FlgK